MDGRRPLVPNNNHPPQLSPHATDHPLSHAHLPPQHLFHDGRDLSHAAYDGALESSVYAVDDVDGDSAVVDGSAAGKSVECRCGGVVEGWGFGWLGECGEVLDGGGEVGWAGLVLFCLGGGWLGRVYMGGCLYHTLRFGRTVISNLLFL